MLMRPVVINPSPSILSLMFGGLVGTVIALAVLYGAAVAAAPRLDVLTTVGAIFSSDPVTAFGVGTILLLGASVTVLPLTPLALTTVLPATHVSLPSALLNGVVVGGAFWVAVGSVLGLAAAVADGPPAVGLMGFSAGLAGGAVFAVASLLYGLSVACITFMEQGLSPFDAIGWDGFTHAATGPLDLGIHRSGDPPTPGAGERPWRSR